MNNELLYSVFRRAQWERGQSLVETAVTVPLLLLMLLGGAELARLAYASIEVTNAAKAAAQYGAQNRTMARDLTGMQTAATNEAYDLSNVSASVTRTLVCSDGTVPLDGNTNGGPWSNTDCATSQIEELLTVTTTATFNPLIHVSGLPTSFTITGQAIQKVLQ